MGCLRIAKQIEQGLGCDDHAAHAEFAFLTSNFGGQLTRGGVVASDIKLLDNLKMALENCRAGILPNLTD